MSRETQRRSSGARAPGLRMISTVVAALALVAVIIAGCMTGPRNGATYENKATPVGFSGYYVTPAATISLFIQNNATGAFDPIPHAPILTSTSATTDAVGQNWYVFSATDVVLPAGAAYWAASSARFNVAKVKAVADGFTMVSFDVGANGCINANLDGGGMQVLSNCQSSSSPVATLNAKCGALKGDCCLGAPACDNGVPCTSGKCKAPCGALGLACCDDGSACTDSTMTCSAGTCQKCGGTGQPCCGSRCGAGNSCIGGTCKCGALNEACCTGHKCGGGTVCEPDGQCHSCGKVGQLCCDDNSCPGLTCIPSSPATCSCGNENQACCPNGGGCNPSFTCQGGSCRRPGTTGPQCAAAGSACATASGPYCCAGSLCTYGTCKTCIAHGTECGGSLGQLCCSSSDVCVLDQFSGKAQCGIRDDTSPAPPAED